MYFQSVSPDSYQHRIPVWNSCPFQKLRVRENIRGEVYVKDLGEVLVTCEEDIYSYLDAGERGSYFSFQLL